MTPFRDARIADACAVPLAAPDDFDGWREQARRLIMAEVPPDRVVWTVPGEGNGDLFAEALGQSRRLPAPAPAAPQPRVSRAFLTLAKAAAIHSNPHRFALLYRLLWRLQGKPGLLEDAADADVRRLNDLSRAVRRDIHKMRAFVRFRSVADADGQEQYVAWFEPSHHILRTNAAFFVNRFTQMRWSILTPRGSLHWDGAVLHEGPPARREDAPGGDPAEDLWRQYYSSIFNPARLKVGAMVKEMPRRYWKNLPEAALIPELIAGAQAREAAMVSAGGDTFAGVPLPQDLDALARGLRDCRRCPIGCNGTRAVPGEGPTDAALMIVGEQPGDNEEMEGRPFIGPAGQLLTDYLGQAGIDRAQARLTNAVKHFKFEPRGKRRLHQNPTAKEIDICRWWLDAERAIVRPKLVLGLGASAGRSLLGKTTSIQQVRGRPIALADGSELWLTVHPSYLLRLDGEALETESSKFAADLAAVAARRRELV
ncbi:UdgX family uracil-DNA binding protein [Novosphingobium sp.]|uniref:UdgX family uracil-DNA binding protein n=1 Tax=Novosphingobium sp. TaxID=1874826 RepID=UPI00286DA836|nr:UdgX family uracil-DNA binding protein [Novosphingobium sp.]